MRFFEWNSCLLFNPKGERENNCALQYASLVMSKFSVFSDVLFWIWSIHWNVKSDNTCGVRLKCEATSQVFLFVFIEDLWFLNLTLNSVVVVYVYIYIYIYMFRMKNWKSNDVVTSQYEILTDPFWVKKHICREWESNPRSLDYMSGVLTTAPSRQPCWKQSNQRGDLLAAGLPSVFIIQEQDYIGSSEEDSQATRNT